MPAQFARVTAVAATGAVSAFEIALALGAPWGAVAFGGQHPGVLPRHLRWTAAGAGLAWGTISATAWRTSQPSAGRRRLALRGAAIVSAVGVPLNLASPAPAERWWSLLATVSAASLWQVSRPDRAPRLGR